jgi:hypothetical protein
MYISIILRIRSSDSEKRVKGYGSDQPSRREKGRYAVKKNVEQEGAHVSQISIC